MARIASAAADDIDPEAPLTTEARHIWDSTWNYRFDRNTSHQIFQSFTAKFAPWMWAGDPYTALMSWDLTNPRTTTNKTTGMGMEITGHGNRGNFTQPFEPQNIIMLTDGFYASTCSVFSSGMQIQGGVKTVVMGGRPNNEPMQGVGGVKGAEVLEYRRIWEVSRILMSSRFANASAEQKESLLQLTSLPMQRSTTARLNVRDQILRDNIGNEMPAQFVNEPADCRLYWTFGMVGDVREIWKPAANAAWNGHECVAGTGFGTKTLGHRVRRKGIVTPLPEAIVISDADTGQEQVALMQDLERYNQKV